MFDGQPRLSDGERALLQWAAAWQGHGPLETLTADTLRGITRDQGVDFATAFLFDRYLRSSRHGGFIQRIDGLRQLVNTDRRPLNGRRDFQIAVVPGALYVERPDLGGDGRVVRAMAERLGLRSTLVPLASTGSVSENARRLLDWLALQGDDSLILVSLSKGGADLKRALAAPGAGLRLANVMAWVNVCGPLDGAAMADWICASRLRTWLCQFHYWATRRDFGFVAELRRESCATPLHLPAPMRLVNLVGFPLKRHLVTPFSRFCHRTLSSHGPNDGTVLLADTIQWPGETYPVWGVDHYFRPESMAASLIFAVLCYLAETAEGSAVGELTQGSTSALPNLAQTALPLRQ